MAGLASFCQQIRLTYVVVLVVPVVVVVMSRYGGGTSKLLDEVVRVVVVVLEIHQYRVTTFSEPNLRGDIGIDRRHLDAAGTGAYDRAVTT